MSVRDARLKRVALGAVVWPLITIFLLFSPSCGIKTQTRTLIPREEFRSLDGRSPFLKAHMLDGRVYVLHDWHVDESARLIGGRGSLLGINREELSTGPQIVVVDSVAIFETNLVQTSPLVGVMSVVTGVSVAATIYCIANPKACFGSCPTFYAETDTGNVLQAEGFSASVAPSLEAADIDALYRSGPARSPFAVRMTNEALETHVLRRVDLLLARRPPGGRVLATLDGVFWQATRLLAPVSCSGPEGDCLPEMLACDGRERGSLADSTDLGARETITLNFDSTAGRKLGLVIGSRQSLLSTFLYYQTLAYMGHEAGQWLARLERDRRARTVTARREPGDGDATRATGWARNDPSGEGSARPGQAGVAGSALRGGSSNVGIGNVLGRIEVQVLDRAGRWTTVGEVGETGPLALNVHLCPLPAMTGGPQTIRLRLAKGLWRLDFVALAVLGDPIEPIRLAPHEVRRGGACDEPARASLCDPERLLRTLPGDAYTLVYTLPDDGADYELFLDSQGYYLEWIRQEWLAEENQALAVMMLAEPALALHMLAPAFKAIEPEIESMFWESRYAHP